MLSFNSIICDPVIFAGGGDIHTPVDLPAQAFVPPIQLLHLCKIPTIVQMLRQTPFIVSFLSLLLVS